VDRETFERMLASTGEQLNFPLEHSQRGLLLDYLEQLIKWNCAYNLSAVRDPLDMMYKHILDSLVIAPKLDKLAARRILDVGTGGGLPGMVLAICFPQRVFTLLDSAGKKTRFLRQTAHLLGLKNVHIEHRRVESYHPSQDVDLVLSRAFSSLQNMVDWCEHLLNEHTIIWAMKGLRPLDELSAVEKHYKVQIYSDLLVPGNIGERCLVELRPR